MVPELDLILAAEATSSAFIISSCLLDCCVLTRISGYLLESALQAGLAAAGVDVWLAGPMPTPAIAYLTRALRLSAGVVISASHNPYDDNGIKFFGANGHKLPDQVERRIEERMGAPMRCSHRRNSARLGGWSRPMAGTSRASPAISWSRRFRQGSPRPESTSGSPARCRRPPPGFDGASRFVCQTGFASVYQ